ncbi:hypothetical protein HQ590_16550 [bacterium]|nr:hypothetical protein [bacterium]
MSRFRSRPDPARAAAPAAAATSSPAPAAPPAKREPPARRWRLKLFGVGGAGGNTVNAIATARAADPDLLQGVDLVAVNTDRQALDEVAADDRIQLGAELSHGLGAGGDMELGRRAAQQETERLTAAVQGADIVFITAGLGGGTGGGAAAVVARLAKEQGALVLAFVALPFMFEGDRRRQQALEALDQLKAQADAVIAIPNDKLFKLAGENAGALETFRQCDAIIAGGAQAIWQLLGRKGLINLDFAALRSTLGGRRGEGLFGHGEGQGAEKAKEAIKALLENPLFDSGQSLGRSEGVLVSILGGPDLSISDVQKTVEPISRLAHRAHVIMGAAIDESYRGKLAVTVIAATNQMPRKVSVTPPAPVTPATKINKVVVPLGTGRAGVRAAPAAEPVEEPAVGPLPPKGRSKPKQGDLPLNSVTRGRFDKSEPTIVEGEDLDVPTFLRRGGTLGN